MCGIICEIYESESCSIKDHEILQRIRKRGPDCSQIVDIKVNDKTISFCGSVLWMQGDKPTTQPVTSNKGILLYNGDIYEQNWNSKRSDTEQVMEKLNSTLVHSASSKEIVEKIMKWKGPFSLIYLNKVTNEIIFGRDKIGRNSLLLYKNGSSVTISSVLGRQYDCIEIPANNMYIYNIITNKLTLCSWNHETSVYELESWLKSVQELQMLPDNTFSPMNGQLLDISDEDNVKEYIESISLKNENKYTVMKQLLDNNIIKCTVLKILKLLELSTEVRVKRQPNKCKDCLLNATCCAHSSVGILFSGGLDCTILAYLADKYVPKHQSIDLINVAFNNNNTSFDVPDRLTGKQSLQELKDICPSRIWNFKEINVTKSVLSENQENFIADLVHPRQTILDESLGSALWFAASGEDNVDKSPCRVLLIGSGADELFGGYTRHRNAYKRQSWSGLQKELALDWERISFRNLARDNRVICDHGRQPRMPYLDEDFAHYVLGLKPWLRCFPSEHLGAGVGDKLFLRLVAFHLGLTNVATFPKRALQFGSRIANKKEKGSDLSKRFHKQQNKVEF